MIDSVSEEMSVEDLEEGLLVGDFGIDEMSSIFYLAVFKECDRWTYGDFKDNKRRRGRRMIELERFERMNWRRGFR